MSRENTFVIVGGGLAAGKTAEELRQAGHQGPVLVIGDESERPYIRPPLSKGYLLGKEERDSIHVHPEGWYQDHGVDLILGTSVTTVDVRSKEVALPFAHAGRARLSRRCTAQQKGWRDRAR
jgi:NADPH-dependent 2,4-dienoyl-CoA reductase/sulfur reductase-like enzyme